MGNKLQTNVLEKRKMTGIRNIIAKRMRQSLDTATQATHVIEIDASSIIEYRQTLMNQGDKISITDIIIKVTALALTKMPLLNSTLVNNEITIYKDVNIALAIAVENGIVTPVIRNVDKISLNELHTRVKDLVLKARSGKLSVDDFEGSTFTISNLGMYAIDQFTAIINPPQAGILAVSAIKKRAVVNKNDEIVIRPIMKVTLTYDHRILDGAPAAEFLVNFKDICESYYNK